MDLGALISETRNPASMSLDQLSTLEMMALFNQEDRKVPEAISQILPDIAAVVDATADCLKSGGRLIYMGAGTSGRLGVLDASECPPTFGIPHDCVIGLIAGGSGAMFKAVEGAEDDPQLGGSDLAALSLSSADMVIGLAASGRTPYVIGGLRYARRLGCRTAAISCNPLSPIAQEAEFAISPVVGPEVLTGSTRLKSGTAQKLILNMISTGAMVRMGKVYQNLMVDVKATNVKLVDRACRILMEATGTDRESARHYLAQTGYEVKPAIVMILTGCDVEESRRRLARQDGYLRNALQP
ncbi:N-acetylmuramic acid 6-phosphate etherase [Musicola paradisiaca]|uniref:N-acetylmuramic acid 6-phosphate etherase n=1 Tax=Musicola paradisiaca (strain Ech703) TaxID=579405 RepID=C6CAQ4_MUSP7|nr:N-acetylmuramic acid 6-phosphate etherase [Musicola paradisiaca]ACS86552.1 glucokinase regulatory-like protein [Musicola paradisiaca Ech703]